MNVLRDDSSNAVTVAADPFYVVIPSVATFTDEEMAAYENGGYPVRRSSHLPEHETFADYIIDRSLDAWTRSRG